MVDEFKLHEFDQNVLVNDVAFKTQVMVQMGYMQKDLAAVAASVAEHRTEHKKDNDELRVIVLGAMDKLDSKIEEHKKDQGGRNDSYSKHITELKRDHKWMYGIFLALWSGIVAWVKITVGTSK